MKNDRKSQNKKARKAGYGRSICFGVGFFLILLAANSAFATTVNLASDFKCTSLTLTNTGALALKGYDMTAGAVTFNAVGGVLNASQAGGPDATQITVTGNWTNTAGGTFTADNSTVIIGGSGTSEISGSNTFNHLTSTTAGKTIHFQALSTVTQTIVGTLTLTGASGNLIVLNRRAGDTGQWRIDPQGTRSVSYVNVANANNISTTLIQPANSTDSGSNTRWFLGALSSVSVTQTSLVAGATGNATIAFTNANAIPVNGDVQITFPSGFDVSGITTASSAADITGVLTASVSGQVVTVNLGSGLSASIAVDDLVLNNVKNPAVSGSTGTFAIETQDASDVKI
ncbi:MAG: hypothetical protein HY587_06865, partial [Candidatus Omnitrophica bacterium]|nr:hypothetical protein [Candidatus Omnitrophota bacterium]